MLIALPDFKERTRRTRKSKISKHPDSKHLRIEMRPQVIHSAKSDRLTKRSHH